MENISAQESTSIIELNKKSRRRSLLPWWIKTFTWIFLIFGAMAPIGFMLGILGVKFQLALYGLETFFPTSFLGLLLTAIFLFKGVTAFGLWTEKNWAITFAQVDAVLGIIICVFVMLVYPFIDDYPGFMFRFRLEILILIPFLSKLSKIKNDWNALAN